MFVNLLLDEIFESLADSTGSKAFNKLPEELDREYGSKSQTDALKRVQSRTVAYGTIFYVYLPAYRSHVTDSMSCDPMHRLTVGAVVAAVRDKWHLYLNSLCMQLFTGATANDRYSTPLHKLWQRLENMPIHVHICESPA